MIALRRALPKTITAPIRDAVRAELERLGVLGRGRKSAVRELPPFQQITHLARTLRVSVALESLMTDGLRSMIASLGGPTVVRSGEVQLLVSPPRQGRFTVEGARWHVDIASDGASPGIQIFALLDDVAPSGGGTLALAGSQRLSRPSVRALHRALADGPLADALRAHGLSLVEMSGRAGDVFLMDLRVLHAPSINASERPRIMVTSRLLAR